MMERRIIKVMLISLTAMTACYYDVEEELYPASNCVTTNLSFQTHIVPILQRNCYGCHSAAVNAGDVTLEGHGQVLMHVNSRRLLGAIRHEPDFDAMPPRGAAKLINCDIAKIENWILDGAPDN